MNMDYLLKTAFINPFGENHREIKQIIEKFTTLLLEHIPITYYHEQSEDNYCPVLGEIPETGKPLSEILENLGKILKGSLNPYQPQYIGHMDSIPTLMSSLGEYISSSLNNNMLSFEMSPLFSKMEVQLIQHICQLFGLGKGAGGVMVSGGTLANIQALCIARNRAFPTKDMGLHSYSHQPVIFASDCAHTSLQKAAMILGLGSSAIIPVKTNQHAQMESNDLEEKIRECLLSEKKPFAIVATAGTTVTGNIDPLQEIANIAKKYNLWLHVDAAYGGSLVFSSTYKNRIFGIEQADSVTFNPQKWMYIAKTCAMVLFKDKNLLQDNFRISAPYMNETEFVNLGEISIQGTRHADILKFWLSLQHIGIEGYDALIDQSFDLASFFTREVKKRDFLELATEPETNIVCFRITPSNIASQNRDQWNLKLQKFLLQEEQIFLSLPIFKGSRWLRAVLLNPYTTKKLVENMFKKIDFFIMHNHSQI
ncbi:MAG: aminotransferase class I/II-fold pyridoxal phosphate-dependent enzyme [Bacillota bacterium]|nr:aminotransferase class I/II-fold pyridoxal phosphate-dependent enzyme [Bacillota bacterium]